MDGLRRTRAMLVGCLVMLCFGWAGLSAPGGRAVQAMQAAPAPTLEAGAPAVAHLTGASINKTAPDEVLQSVDLPVSRMEYPGCLRFPEAPQLNYNTNHLSLTDITIISTCGWQPDEVVKVTLMEPTGKLLTSEVKASPSKYLKNVYQVDVFYQPGVDAPLGKYRFTLQGTTQSSSNPLKVNLFYDVPLSNARLYALPTDRFQPLRGTLGGQQRLRLNGFLANEPLRLLAYRFEGTRIQFYGWQDYKTDSNGRLIIETDLPEIGPDVEMNYFAYGLETHFVPLERFTRESFSKTKRFDMDLYCPSAQTPRLSNPGFVQFAPGQAQLDIHLQPGFGSRINETVSADTPPIRISGYPKCVDRNFWWPITLTKPLRYGWVAESFLGKYLLEPANISQ